MSTCRSYKIRMHQPDGSGKYFDLPSLQVLSAEVRSEVTRVGKLALSCGLQSVLHFLRSHALRKQGKALEPRRDNEGRLQLVLAGRSQELRRDATYPL